MGQNIFHVTPEVIQISPGSGGNAVAGGGTGSFQPVSIAKTPYIGFMITKLTDKSAINSLILQTTNFRDEFPAGGSARFPSGSALEYLWCNEPSYSVSPGGTGSLGGVSGSLFSGSIALAPFVTGTSPGSVMFHTPTPLNARYARITVRADNGGRFQLIAIGKLGD